MTKPAARRLRRAFLLFVLAAAAGAVYWKRESIRQLPIGCGVKAKILCSGVFVAGRDPAAVEREDLGFHPLLPLIKARIDRERKTVTASLLGLGLFRKTAVYREKLGAVLLSGVPADRVSGGGEAVPEPEPADPGAVDWPIGDRGAEAPLPDAGARARLAAVVASAFDEPDPKDLRRTRALLVLVDGKIAAERYAPGFDRDTRLISWSIGKSVTGALIGILAGQGRLDLKAPAPVPEWAAPGDPRGAITTEDLLRMSSGLEWSEAYAERPVSDVNRMLFLKPDMAAFAAAKPLVAPPGTVWNYSTGTTVLLSRILRRVIGDEAAYRAFPRRELFNKIGLRSAVFETDAAGTFAGCAFLYATARDFARFGLLYLNDGLAGGRRVLPEGWVAYAATPAPAAGLGQYGAQVWLNRGAADDPGKREFPRLPADMISFLGYQGQAVAVLPSRRLVAVRLGMTYDDEWGMGPFLESLLAALD